MKSFKFIDLFCGIGGFHLAMSAVGGECVFASEIDKFAKQAYTTLHGLEPHGDITKIDAEDIPDHDLLTAGVPCQPWSIAGKRGGFDDARGSMWEETARIIREKKPKVFLVENVKGMLSHNKGDSFEEVCEKLSSIGYHLDFSVINSKYFGVPQNRERVFLIGVRSDIIDRQRN